MGSNLRKNIEILAPAGSMESMKAAFMAGADAVYMGGSRFGARAFANNPEEEDLKRAIDYAHLHDKKLYLTMNTLFKDKELEDEAYDFLKPYYEEGLDGIIIQDLGLLSMLKDSFPKLPLHASTQMTITGVETAKWLENQGLERIVLSRELSLDEIKKIRNNTKMELEVFVQGALCYCYSGQCLMSSFIGGRSGNRGRCAQPCRLPYQVGDDKKSDYLISPKDICTLEDIPNLVDGGVNSFKIEGRMKKTEYAALTAYLYRHYVDQYLTYGRENFHIDVKDMERLMDLYNRGGFSGGYLHQHNGGDMIFRERPNHMGVPAGKISKKGDIRAMTGLNAGDVLEIRGKDGKAQVQWTLSQPILKDGMFKLQAGNRDKKNVKYPAGTTVFRVRNQVLIDELHNAYVNKDLKEKIYGTLRIVKDSPVILMLTWKDIQISVQGVCAQKANNQPMSEEQLKKPVLKTGNTPFVFETLEVETDGCCYVPNSQLNDLRRRALEMLEEEYLKRYKRKDAVNIPLQPSLTEKGTVGNKTMPEVHVRLAGMELLKRGRLLSEFPWIKRVYVELHEAIQDQFQTVRLLKKAGKNIYFSMPAIFREKDRDKLKKFMREAEHYADGWLVHQLETALFVRSEYPETNMTFDSGIYAMNRRAKRLLETMGNVTLTAPVELNYSELRALNCCDMELMIYGHQLLMISAQCIKKTHEGCTRQPDMIQLTDRQHKHFYAYNECEFCYNKIYNGSPTMLLDKKKELLTLNPLAFRMDFTMENKEQMSELLKSFDEIYIQDRPERNVLKEFTRGHFTRGIE